MMPPSLILPEYAPIQNVVFVMEDTASAGPFIQELKANYIVPILDHFTDGGQKVVLPFASIKCTSTFTLVVFHAADSHPKYVRICDICYISILICSADPLSRLIVITIFTHGVRVRLHFSKSRKT